MPYSKSLHALNIFFGTTPAALPTLVGTVVAIVRRKAIGADNRIVQDVAIALQVEPREAVRSMARCVSQLGARVSRCSASSAFASHYYYYCYCLVVAGFTAVLGATTNHSSLGLVLSTGGL
jgi:hypothetical protein